MGIKKILRVLGLTGALCSNLFWNYTFYNFLAGYRICWYENYRFIAITELVVCIILTIIIVWMIHEETRK